jgi:hypothetical protein
MFCVLIYFVSHNLHLWLGSMITTAPPSFDLRSEEDKRGPGEPVGMLGPAECRIDDYSDV